MSNVYRFPIEERMKAPARKFDEPATIYYLANERIERGLARIARCDDRPKFSGGH